MSPVSCYTGVWLRGDCQLTTPVSSGSEPAYTLLSSVSYHNHIGPIISAEVHACLPSSSDLLEKKNKPTIHNIPSVEFFSVKAQFHLQIWPRGKLTLIQWRAYILYYIVKHLVASSR